MTPPQTATASATATATTALAPQTTPLLLVAHLPAEPRPQPHGPAPRPRQHRTSNLPSLGCPSAQRGTLPRALLARRPQPIHLTRISAHITGTSQMRWRDLCVAHFGGARPLQARRRSQGGAHAEPDWSTGSCTMGRKSTAWDRKGPGAFTSRRSRLHDQALLNLLNRALPDSPDGRNLHNVASKNSNHESVSFQSTGAAPGSPRTARPSSPPLGWATSRSGPDSRGTLARGTPPRTAGACPPARCA